jgi:hypothetical protein
MTMFAIAAALVAAAPEPAPAPAPTAPVAEQSSTISIAPENDTRRVCIVDEATGSRFPQKVCQTRAQWAAEGLDPLAKR